MANGTAGTPKKDPLAVFLGSLRKSGNVSTAARAARLGRSTVYRHRETDPEFAAAWDEALEEAVDTLEAEAWRRARDGTVKPVFQGGEQVGKVREYSDTLLIFLLKGHRPQRFRERLDVHVKENDLDAAIAAGLEKLASRSEDEAPAAD